MDICFITSRESLKLVPEALDSNKTLFVCFDFLTKQSLLEDGRQAVLYDATISKERGEAADRLAFGLSKEWHYFGKDDFTAYKGASLGRAHEWMLWWGVFVPKLKFLSAALCLVESNGPETVYFEKSLESWKKAMLEAALKKENPSAKLLEFGENGKDGNAGVLGGTLSGWKLDRAGPLKSLFTAGYRLAGRIGQALRAGKPRVLYGPYFSLNNVLLEWSKTQPFDLVLLSPSSAVFSKKEILLSLPGIFGIDAKPAETGQGAQKIIQAWNRIRLEKNYSEKYAFEGIDIYKLFEGDIDCAVRENLPKYARELDAYAQSLKKEKIGLVALPFDVPPRECLLLQAARICGIPSAIMLHGFPCTHQFNDRDNTLADNLFVWGDWLQDRFEGVRSNRSYHLLKAGNPKFDSIPLAKPKERTPGKKSVLVLSNPKVVSCVYASDEEPENYIRGLLQELSGLDITVTVKLHPSESLEYYKELVEPFGKNISLVREREILKCMQESDIVVCPLTTVLFESLILGKPTVFYNGSRFVADAPIFQGKGDINSYRNAKEVKDAVLSIINNEPGCMDGHSLGTDELESYCGKLDGKSSERTVGELCRLAKTGMKNGSAGR